MRHPIQLSACSCTCADLGEALRRLRPRPGAFADGGRCTVRPMSRLPRRFGRNLITSYLNTATVAVITVVTTPVLIDGLGREGFGIWSLVASFALYIKLLDLGFGKGDLEIRRRVRRPRQLERLRRAVVTSFWLLAIPGLGALVIGAVLTEIFPSLFNISSGLERETQISDPPDRPRPRDIGTRRHVRSALIGLQRLT